MNHTRAFQKNMPRGATIMDYSHELNRISDEALELRGQVKTWRALTVVSTILLAISVFVGVA